MMNSDHMGPVNLGNPDEFSIRQLAEMVRDKINPDLQLIHRPLPADDPLQRQPVIALARQELGWQPSIDLEQGLDATIAYFRQALG
jgi:UDP-glucuronate decarboxylase